MMKLIIGLGNPGRQYKTTWHNIGFSAIDRFKDDFEGFSNFENSKKFKAEIAKSDKIILAKPQTYMNNSGQAVKLIASFYKIKPTDIWIVHDDIDLPLGTVRISQNASAAGHNGIKSIILELGTKNFTRFRIGIRPDNLKMPTEKFVLKRIGLRDKTAAKEAISKTADAIKMALEKDIPSAMNRFN